MKINAFFACTDIDPVAPGIANIKQAGIRTVNLSKFKKGETFKIRVYCLFVTEPTDVPGAQVARIELIGTDGPMGTPQDTPFSLINDPGFMLPITVRLPADGPISLNFRLSILGSNVEAYWPLRVSAAT
jgi:hypothetical protein